MPDNQPNELSEEQLADSQKFAEVTAGVYRRFDAESVWMALRHTVNHQLHSENPTIMLMFVRIAEVHPDAADYLRDQQPTCDGALSQAIDLVLNPPEDLRGASYLPDKIGSPGEMDLCWSEFLVTGDSEVIQKVVSVLDREDVTRVFLRERLSAAENPIELTEQQRMELQQFGIGIGALVDDGGWDVMTPGDTDVFLWLGVKEQNATCVEILQAMTDEQKIHVANKGAALWSLQANANQHGKIRILCENAAQAEGGFARKLLEPNVGG